MIFWIYGKPYAGKTKFASEFPKPFFISLDKNAQYITDDYVNVNSIQDYSDELSKFLKDPGDRETLVIDLIDLVEQYTRAYYLEKQDIEDEGDLDDYGRTWRLIREGTYRSILKAMEFQGNIVFISHETENITKNMVGNEITHYEPGLNKKLHSRISGLTTVIGRAYKDSKKVGGEIVNRYYISFGSVPEELSGTRIPLKETIIENTFEAFQQNINKG